MLSLTPFLFGYDTACYQTAIIHGLPLKNQYSSSIPLSFESVITKTLTPLLTNMHKLFYIDKVCKPPAGSYSQHCVTT